MSGRLLRLEALVAGVCLIASEAVVAGAEPFDRAQGGQAVPQRPASWISEILVAELPKFVPQTNEDVESTIADEPAVEKDGVLALPTMRIRPVMKESPSDYSFLTAKGRLELAQKTYPGLRFGNIFGLNNGIGLFKQMEEQEVRKKAVLLNRVQRSAIDNGPESLALFRLIKEAIVRPNTEALNGRVLP